MGFGPLRVINDDVVDAGRGFGTHPHRDMEILTWVLDGELQHRDSLGTGSVIRPGEVQIMSAGTGIQHSEFNPSPMEPVHLLQIWILPERAACRRATTSRRCRSSRACCARSRPASPRPAPCVSSRMRRCMPRGSQADSGSSMRCQRGRTAWVQVARGAVRLDGTPLREGDGAAVTGQDRLAIQADGDAEVLVFDLSMRH